MSNRDCEHGQQARSCNICEMEKEIEQLKAENEKLKKAICIHMREQSDCTPDNDAEAIGEFLLAWED